MLTKPVERMSREELEEEVLYYRNAAAEALQADKVRLLAQAIGFTPNEARVALCLYTAKRTVLREALLTATVRLDHAREVTKKTLDVMLHRVRFKLGAFGLVVFDGYGWTLTEEGRAIIARALEQPPA